ncbi:MAG: hypothetical protein ACI93G_001565 [Hyphomonas sp.]|jgi:hypothetical protein
MGLKVRLLGQSGAASPVWKTVAEPRQNGPFMCRSSARHKRFFRFFLFWSEFGTVRLIIEKAECVNKHPESVYLFGTIRSVMHQ